MRYSKLDNDFRNPARTPAPSLNWDWEKLDAGVRLGITPGPDLTVEGRFADVEVHRVKDDLARGTRRSHRDEVTTSRDVPLDRSRSLRHTGERGPGDPHAWFLFAEASRLMYADRDLYVGDPAFVRIVHKGHLRRPMRDLRLLDYERHMLEHALR